MLELRSRMGPAFDDSVQVSLARAYLLDVSSDYMSNEFINYNFQIYSYCYVINRILFVFIFTLLPSKHTRLAIIVYQYHKASENSFKK